MKAAILHRPLNRVSVEDVDIASPRQGEVLLDIVGAGSATAIIITSTDTLRLARSPG